MQISIDRLNDTGDGVGKIQDKITFVSKTVVGDVVDVEIVKEYKNYQVASIKKIIKRGSNYLKSECPYFSLCGGCQLMNIDYSKQLDYKKDKVINIFLKYAKMNINPIIVGSDKYNYRNKILLHVSNGKLGLYKNNSHDLVEIDKCLLVSNEINNIIKILKEKINLSCVNSILIRKSDSGIMIWFKGSASKEDILKELSQITKSIYINNNCIYGDKCLYEKLEDYKFKISKESFFQVNKSQTLNIYNKVKEYVKGYENVLDLYCGTGTIGIFVANNNKHVTGIEINKNAIMDAKINKEINNIKNIDFQCGSVGKVLKSYVYYDAVIVDPPRSGLDTNTKNILKKMKSKIIVYVSCNPVTLARDILDLSEDYKLNEITLYDMFPNTYHVETVVLLKLRKPL